MTRPHPENPRSARSFEIEIVLDAATSVVWEAIATDSGLQRWFATGAQLTPGVGGEVVWRWSDQFTWPQKIEVWEPGRRLRTRYDSPVADGKGGRHPLFIDWALSGEGGRTRLRLVQSGFGSESDFDQEYDGISRGWPVELRSLKLYLEQHLGRDRRLAWCSFAVALSPDETWRRMTGSAGLGCGERIAALREGEHFHIDTPDGDRFEGNALVCGPREFSGVAENWGNGFLRISAEHVHGVSHPWVWLATWSVPRERVAELEARWKSRMRELFAAEVTAGLPERA